MECARIELLLNRLPVLKPERQRGFQLSELEYVYMLTALLLCSSRIGC